MKPLAFIALVLVGACSANILLGTGLGELFLNLSLPNCYALHHLVNSSSHIYIQKHNQYVHSN